MFIPRLRRLAEARRLVVITLVLFGVSARPAAADVSGIVVDQSGRAVLRAYLRILDSAGVESAAAFADEVGRLELKTNVANCRVETSLTGFEAASVPCTRS